MNGRIVQFDNRQPSFPEYLSKSVRELVFFQYALGYLVMNSLRTRYRRSYLGFFWSLVNPLLTMLVISVVFSALWNMRFRDFGIYIFSGLLPWMFFSNSLGAGCVSLINAEKYMKKIYLAKLLFPLAAVCTETINLVLSMISLLVLALVIGGHVGWSLLLLPFAVGLIFMFVLGLAIAVSVMDVYFRDLPYIIQVVLMALFYAVPIIYPMSRLPETIQNLLILNPIYHFIVLFQMCIYEGRIPSLSTWVICLGLSLASLVTGMLILHRNDRDLIYRL